MELEEGQKNYKEFLMNPQKDYHMSEERKNQLSGLVMDVDKLETIIKINTINRYVAMQNRNLRRAS